MGNWGHDEFAAPRLSNHGEAALHDVIQSFPAGLKQAMFAAASRTTIKRGTWNGCAMNAAGIEVGKLNKVQSFESASEAFGVSEGTVQRFVHLWDQLQGTDEECTQKLRTMIENANLFEGPAHERKTRIVNVLVYENEQNRLRREFDELMAANNVPDEELANNILVGALSSTENA